MEIREVRPEEFEEAGRVCALAYREFAPPEPSPGWDEYFEALADVRGRAEKTIVLVAVEGSRVLGTTTIEMDSTLGDDDDELPEDTAALRMLGVDPGTRGLGVGRALVDDVIARCRGRGKRELILRTTERMRIAQRLYVSMGFQRDSGLDETFPEVHLIGYRLTL